MSAPKRVIALDPGQTSGYAEFILGEKEPLQLVGQGVIEGGCPAFIDTFRLLGYGDRIDLFICERFVIDGTHTGVWSPQIEGALMAMAAPDQEIVWHLRSDKANLTNPKHSETQRFNWLRERGFTGTSHELDAITHGLVWAKNLRHVPTLKEYWA